MFKLFEFQLFLRLFEMANGNLVRLFLLLFCTSLAAIILISFPRQWAYFDSNPTRLYEHKSRILGFWKPPILDKLQFQLMGFILSASLLAATTGILTRLMLSISLTTYFFYFSQIKSLDTLVRKINLIPIVLIILIVSPSINASFEEPVLLWPLWLVKISIVQMYFSAGLQKLRRAGVKWIDGQSLQKYMVDHYLWGDMNNALWFAKHPRLCKLASISTLIFELTIWIILFWPELTLLYVALAILFHCGTAITMRIRYLKYLIPIYMVFVIDIIYLYQ